MVCVLHAFEALLRGKRACVCVVFRHSKMLTQFHESRTWGATKTQQTAHNRNTQGFFFPISALISILLTQCFLSRGSVMHLPTLTKYGASGSFSKEIFFLWRRK